MNLIEETRSTILNNSRGAQKETDGKTRYDKRIEASISPNVRNYNSINMDKLFKEDILDVQIDVKGKTDNYIVSVSFSNFLEALRRILQSNKVELKSITQALVQVFNQNNVYVRCNCPDAQFRQNYWQSVEDVIYGNKESRPSNITNPKNNLGRGCKHVMLVLSNHKWLLKVASVINNYCNYMQNNYPRSWADTIYPAIYGKKYEEPVQLDTFDTSDQLASDKDTINKANEIGRLRGRFSSTHQPNRPKKEKDISDELTDIT